MGQEAKKARSPWWIAFLFYPLLMGCQTYVELDGVRADVARLVATQNVDSIAVAQARIDSVLLLDQSLRVYDDSLAHADSLHMAYFRIARTAIYYHHMPQDTVAAFFSFMEALPWLEVMNEQERVALWRKYGEIAGEAMTISQSVNMARLAYDGFQRAEQLAYVQEDTSLYRKVFEAKYKFGVALMTQLPDSVRTAFSVAPLEPPRQDLGLSLILGLVGVLSFGGGTWAWRYRTHKRNQVAAPTTNEVVSPDLSSSLSLPLYLTEESAYLRAMPRQNEAFLDALWWLVFRPDVTREVQEYVIQFTRYNKMNQAALLRAATILVQGVHVDGDAEQTLSRMGRRAYMQVKRLLKEKGWGDQYMPRRLEEWQELFRINGYADQPPSHTASV